MKLYSQENFGRIQEGKLINYAKYTMNFPMNDFEHTKPTNRKVIQKVIQINGIFSLMIFIHIYMHGIFKNHT